MVNGHGMMRGDYRDDDEETFIYVSCPVLPGVDVEIWLLLHRSTMSLLPPLIHPPKDPIGDELSTKLAIEVRSLTFSFGGPAVLKNFSLNLPHGSRCLLIGYVKPMARLY